MVSEEVWQRHRRELDEEDFEAEEREEIAMVYGEDLPSD